MAQKMAAESEEQTVAEFNGYPLAKVFFHEKFSETSVWQARNILLTEVCNVYSQLSESITAESAGILVDVDAAALTHDIPESVAWLNLLNQLLSHDVGRKAFTFLRDVSLRPEISSYPPGLESKIAFAVNLRLHLVGYEFRNNIMRTLHVSTLSLDILINQTETSWCSYRQCIGSS